MNPTPPPGFAEYPRASNVDVPKLRLLADGYHGLSTVFVINVVLSLATNALYNLASLELPIIGLMVLGMGLLVGFLTYPHNKKIGEGKGWSSSGAIVASILMGVNSALCCGIIGYIVMQSIASSALKAAGIKMGFFVTKKSINEQLSRLS